MATMLRKFKPLRPSLLLFKRTCFVDSLIWIFSVSTISEPLEDPCADLCYISVSTPSTNVSILPPKHLIPTKSNLIESIWTKLKKWNQIKCDAWPIAGLCNEIESIRTRWGQFKPCQAQWLLKGSWLQQGAKHTETQLKLRKKHWCDR